MTDNPVKQIGGMTTTAARKGARNKIRFCIGQYDQYRKIETRHTNSNRQHVWKI